MAKQMTLSPIAFHICRLTDEGAPFSQSLRFYEEQASPTNLVTPLIALPEVVATLTAAAALLDRITFDSDGVMVGMERRGGNGGIISNDTLRAADALRRAFDDMEAMHNG